MNEMNYIFWFLVVLYMVCAIIAYGYRGGIREELDGVGDMLFIAFWFVPLLFFIASIPIRIFCKFGEKLREIKNGTTKPDGS